MAKLRNGFYINSTSVVNSLFWITSLNDQEKGATRRTTEDLEVYFNKIGTIFEIHELTSQQHLDEIFSNLSDHASRGLRPVIHLDMHGCKDQGLRIASTGEYVPWSHLYKKLQLLNIETKNNLILVAGVCHSLYVMLNTDFQSPCACYAIIAPKEEVTVGFLESNTLNFYTSIFEGVDMNMAYDKHLRGQMTFYHCESLLAKLMLGYVKRYTMGTAARKRQERVLTLLVTTGALSSKDLTPARKLIKKSIKPTQKMLDDLAKSYLIGKKCGFTIIDIIKLARNE